MRLAPAVELVQGGEQRLALFGERTGHTYQMNEQEIADVLCATVTRWRKGEIAMPFVVTRANVPISAGQEADCVYVRFSDIPVWSVGDMVVDRWMLG